MARSGRPQDRFGRQARRDGYPARSAYKLEEIDRRLRLFRPGQRVLDLGAYPGSWSLYAATRVGEEGSVLGIDLKEPDRGFPPNVEMRQCDVHALDVGALGELDVVLSDMAPSTTGRRDLDQYRSFELFMLALGVAGRILKRRGGFVGKIFQGGDFPAARKAVRNLFATVRILRPEATRTESYETFLVGLDRRSLFVPAGPAPTPDGQEGGKTE